MAGPWQNVDGALNLSRASFCQVTTSKGEGVRSLGWAVELKLDKERSENMNGPEREKGESSICCIVSWNRGSRQERQEVVDEEYDPWNYPYESKQSVNQVQGMNC